MKNLTKDDKWVLVSCLQKSVRKGFDDLAETYAQKLCEIGERSYLAYRLSIMAVEDVGIAALDDIIPFLNTRIKKAEVDKNGGEQYLIDVSKKFALAKKDRTACDLVSLSTGYQPADLTLAQHKEIFLDKRQHEITRALSGWVVLGGKKHKHELIQTDEDRLDEFLALNETLLDKSPVKDKILGILADSYPVHREPHFLVIGLLQSIYENELGVEMRGYKTGDIVKRSFPKELLEDYFLIDGVDIHTSQGKTAAYNFVKRPSLMNEWFNKNNVQEEDRMNVIKCLNFRAIGQQVNERLFYPTASKVMVDIQKETLNRYVGADVSFSEASNAFNASLPIWNQCVAEVIKKKYGKPNPRHFPF